AYDALCSLASSPKETIPFLKARLHAVVAPDAQCVARLITDLDSEQFNARTQAMRELEQLGEGVVPALLRALESKPSAELRRRAEQLLEKLSNQNPSGEKLRALRAIELLEH